MWSIAIVTDRTAAHYSVEWGLHPVLKGMIEMSCEQLPCGESMSQIGLISRRCCTHSLTCRSTAAAAAASRCVVTWYKDVHDDEDAGRR